MGDVRATPSTAAQELLQFFTQGSFLTFVQGYVMPVIEHRHASQVILPVILSLQILLCNYWYCLHF